MKILITGAGGQLGQALPRALAAHEARAFPHGQLDITDLSAVRAVVEREEPDFVMNAAAYNDVDGAESDPIAAYRASGYYARVSQERGKAKVGGGYTG